MSKSPSDGVGYCARERTAHSRLRTRASARVLVGIGMNSAQTTRDEAHPQRAVQTTDPLCAVMLLACRGWNVSRWSVPTCDLSTKHNFECQKNSLVVVFLQAKKLLACFGIYS